MGYIGVITHLLISWDIQVTPNPQEITAGVPYDQGLWKPSGVSLNKAENLNPGE